MRWLFVMAALMAAPAAAQSPGQCREVDAAISAFLARERAHMTRDAALESAINDMMDAAMQRDEQGSVPLRTDATTALGMLMGRRDLSGAAVKAMEDLQHRARLCARQ